MAACHQEGQHDEMRAVMEEVLARHSTDMCSSLRKAMREEMNHLANQLKAHLGTADECLSPLVIARRASLASKDSLSSLASHEWVSRHMRHFEHKVASHASERSDDTVDVWPRKAAPAVRRDKFRASQGKEAMPPTEPAPYMESLECVPDKKGSVAIKVENIDGCAIALKPPSPTIFGGVGLAAEQLPSEAWCEPTPPAWNNPPPPLKHQQNGPPVMFRARSTDRLLKKRRSDILHDFAEGTACPQLREFMVGLVRNPHFDYFVCFLILLNAASIGVQTNYAATHDTLATPVEFLVLENLFCSMFAAEIMLRIYVFRCDFFRRPGWEWNVFDCVVVVLQLVEIIIVGLPNLSFMRMLRVMRLIRAIRLIRILRHITELRTLVTSIAASLASLGWTLVLLMMIIYMISLCITQLVSDHRLLNIDDDREGLFLELSTYYGTLSRSMLSLFQAISGGVDWDCLITPLIDNVSVWLAPLFCLYIAFTFLALMNVVTACFVESVLESTKKEKDTFMVNNVRELFQEVDGGIGNGSLDWETFQNKLEARPMIEFFRALDIDPSEATGLFRLLDLDSGGTVDAEEFLSGCLRFRGPAKALDMALLISEVGKIQHILKTLS